MEDNEYLFESREKDKNGNRKPISYRRALYILQKEFKRVGVDGSCGIHTCRKTFSNHLYNKKGIYAVKIALNHRNIEQTEIYTDIKAREMEKIMNGVEAL